MYADDVTQVITSPSKSKLMMKIKVEREIERISKSERRWKIKTREEKFKIIPIAQLKTKKIKVNGKEIGTSTSGKLNCFRWPYKKNNKQREWYTITTEKI